MSDKTIPVWLHQSPTEKIQIGVAAEVDPDTGAQAIDIWDEFKDYQIENFTIGDDEPAEGTVPQSEDSEEPKILTREEFRARVGMEDQK